jgi:hypothetical protein
MMQWEESGPIHRRSRGSATETRHSIEALRPGITVITPMSSLVHGAFPANGNAGPLPIQYTIPSSVTSGTNLFVAFTVSVQNAAGDTFVSGPTWQLTKP